jgi:hypothetical protein
MQVGHQDRWTDAMPADIADDGDEGSVLEEQKVKGIACRELGWKTLAGDL